MSERVAGADAESAARQRCAGVLLVDGTRVLLARRSPDRAWYPAVWDVIGGHIQPGETSLMAVCREATEELGITLDELSLVHVDTLIGADYTLELYATRTWQGTITNVAPDEHSELGWFEPTELATLALADLAITRLASDAVAGTMSDR